VGRSTSVELDNRPERSAEPRKEPRLPRNRGQSQSDSRLTREAGGRMVLRTGRVQIGNSGLKRFLRLNHN
jgi:hypothetical protein